MVKLQTLSDLSDGAVEMYNDSNFIYNYKYYENLVFFLMISGLGYTFYKSMAKEIYQIKINTFSIIIV